jgi:hypothetical protein
MSQREKGIFVARAEFEVIRPHTVESISFIQGSNTIPSSPIPTNSFWLGSMLEGFIIKRLVKSGLY